MKKLTTVAVALVGATAAAAVADVVIVAKQNADRERQQAAERELRARTAENSQRYASSPEGRAQLEPGRVWFIDNETGELFNARTGVSWCFTREPEGWHDGLLGTGCLANANGRFASAADKAQTVADHVAFDARRKLEFTRIRLATCRTDLTNGRLAPMTQEQMDELLACCIADRPAYLGGP